MRIRFEHLAGSRTGESQSFDRERVRLGRAPDNEVAFDRSEDLSASARHCELFWAAGAVHVRDLGSQNGTFVNGERVTSPTPIRTGDELGLGRDGPLVRVQVREDRRLASSDPTLPARSVLPSGRRRRAISWILGGIFGALVVAALLLVWWRL